MNLLFYLNVKRNRAVSVVCLCMGAHAHMQASGGMSVSKEHSQGFQTCLPALIFFIDQEDAKQMISETL